MEFTTGKSHLRAVVRHFGPAIESVQLESYAPALLKVGELRVKMQFSTINPSDLITISGAYSSRTPLPFVPGFEGVGIVEAGSELVGQRVLPLGSAGAWQQYKHCDANWCFAVPDWLTDEQAATCYVNPMTAWLMLTEALAAAPGMKIVVSAANSTIGLMLIRMAKQLGLTVTAIVRHAGAENVVDNTEPDELLILPHTGNTTYSNPLPPIGDADAVLDCVGGKTAMKLAGMVRQGGKFISYGLLSGDPIPASFWQYRPDIRFSYFHLRQWVHTAGRDALAAKLNEIFPLIRDGIASSRIAGIFPLNELPAALSVMSQNSSQGKILIHCDR
ncbi:TPA: zinc-dependent alcohol dehydrogenase family protein [Yersinia enterocolitica]|nr:zinc-dependent alcohol dehydrogenase family protein [Yersinia enterocolitica]HDL7432938.1 zinc-dependent alcohol dehydrogenase family protein [Yersinia enterocolitica]HDL7475347.1 zinc-dependent alcohol dehydrogenase family protein [Yersinia enterocolitica]HDM8359982.1 zinc-dependent alcohol dehydrogenase family protein [Yersinia enterocolitica]